MKIKMSVLLLLLLIPSLLLAEEEQPEAPPWYEFELIIYANHGAAKYGDELWGGDPGQPSRLNTIPLLYKTATEREAEARYFEMSQLPGPDENSIEEHSLEPSEAIQQEPPSDATQSDEPATIEEIEVVEETPVEELVPFQQLPDELLQLGESYSKLLETKGRLEPLVHMAWRQQIEPAEQAKTLYLILPTDEAEQTPGLPDQAELPQLEGSIKISVKRYLHVEFDMVLRQLTPSVATDTPALTTLSPHYQAYRMQVHRRMRSKDLHYIDHPQMGVLIIARRYEMPQPIEELEPLVDSSEPAEVTDRKDN
jgi:hypothetical protein